MNEVNKATIQELEIPCTSIVLGNTEGFTKNWFHINWKPVFQKMVELQDSGKLRVLHIFYFDGVPQELISMFPDAVLLPLPTLQSRIDDGEVSHVSCFGVNAPLEKEIYSKAAIPTTDDVFPYLLKLHLERGLKTTTYAIDPAQIDPSGDTVYMEHVGFRKHSFILNGVNIDFINQGKYIDTQILMHGPEAFDFLRQMVHDETYKLNWHNRHYMFYGVYSALKLRKTDDFLQQMVNKTMNNDDFYHIFLVDPKSMSYVKEYEDTLKQAKVTFIMKPPIVEDSVSVNRIWQALACGCLPVYANNAKKSKNPLFEGLPDFIEFCNNQMSVTLYAEMLHNNFDSYFRQSYGFVQGLLQEHILSGAIKKTLSVVEGLSYSNRCMVINEAQESDLLIDPKPLWNFGSKHYQMEPKPVNLFNQMHRYISDASDAWITENGDKETAERMASLIVMALNSSKYLGIQELVLKSIENKQKSV